MILNIINLHLNISFKFHSYSRIIEFLPKNEFFYHNTNLFRKFHSVIYGAPKSRAEIRRPNFISDSKYILHYPEISKSTYKPINWMFDQPRSGFEGYEIFGPNTLELKGIPPCKTPEYMQERLHKFFSKYGIISSCRCIPHPSDPYQCEGTAYITFKDSQSSSNATSANIVFPPSLQFKILKIRNLDTNKVNNYSFLSENKSILLNLSIIITNCFNILSKKGPLEIKELYKLIKNNEQLISFLENKSSNYIIENFKKKPLNQLYTIKEMNDKTLIYLKTYSELRFKIILRMFKSSFLKKINSELSQHWRSNKPPLPSIIHKKLQNKKFKPILNPKLQILSRSRKFYNVFDERYLFNNKKKNERKNQQTKTSF